MKITAISFSNQYLKRNGCKNKVRTSAPEYKSADVFYFGSKSNLSKKIGIISSTQPTELEQNIEKSLGIQPLQSVIKKFQNGETYVNIVDKVRGKDIYLMPANDGNVNDNLMETYLKADAAKRAGANRVVAIMPNFDYARQEKRTEHGEPIAAKLNMDLLKTSGVDEVITADLHSPAIEGFAQNSMKINHLESMPLIKQYILDKQLEDMVVVSPDVGGTRRADKLAKALGCEKAVVYKFRKAHNEASAEELMGDVSGKTCIIYDDIIDTAGTISKVSDLLVEKGAKDIYICATHGLFNGKALEYLQNPAIKEVVVTNSLPQKANRLPKIKYLDMSKQITDTIKEISGE